MDDWWTSSALRHNFQETNLKTNHSFFSAVLPWESCRCALLVSPLPGGFLLNRPLPSLSCSPSWLPLLKLIISPKKNSQAIIDFDLIMTSSERRMDFVLLTLVLGPIKNPASGDAQGKKGVSSSSTCCLKLLQEKSSNAIEGVSSPHPRWPLLNWRSAQTSISGMENLSVTQNLVDASSSAVLDNQGLKSQL